MEIPVLKVLHAGVNECFNILKDVWCDKSQDVCEVSLRWRVLIVPRQHDFNLEFMIRITLY